jgi:hypothetical protein
MLSVCYTVDLARNRANGIATRYSAMRVQGVNMSVMVEDNSIQLAISKLS